MYLLGIGSFNIISAMDIPLTVCNDTEEPVIVKDFKLERSSVDIWPLVKKVDKGKTVTFHITPIAGSNEESFNIVIKGVKIPIILKWISGKGMGPFVKQQDSDFRVIKTPESAAGVRLCVMGQNQLPRKEKVQELTQQRNLDWQDLSEQTGFTEDELKRMQ
ncbi:MAG: hypothetical protein LBT90_01115 [Holosporaceae bacterium]|nr:hypothetical protein [Holosporaceae bacterium]